MSFRLFMFLSIVLAAPVAIAQIGNPAFMVADTRMEKPGVPAPQQTNNYDRLFAQLAMAAGMAEVELARIADDKAETGSVQAFARMMLRDHGEANDRIRGLAEAERIPLPDDLAPRHRSMRDSLAGLADDAFDLAYIRGQIIEHQRSAQLLSWHLSSGQYADMQKQSAEMLPIGSETS